MQFENIFEIKYEKASDSVIFCGLQENSNVNAEFKLPFGAVKEAYKMVTGPVKGELAPTPPPAPEKPKKGEK